MAWLAEPENSWQRNAKLWELEKLHQEWNEQLGRKLAAAAPFANERARMLEDMESALYKQLKDLAGLALTRPELSEACKSISPQRNNWFGLVEKPDKAQGRALSKPIFSIPLP